MTDTDDQFEPADIETDAPATLEIVTNASRKISVTFERTIGYEGYGNKATARAWIEHTIPADANISEASMACQDLFAASAAAVFDQLGIEYMMDDQGVIREAKTPIVSVARAETSVERAMPGTQNATPEGGFTIRVMNPNDQQGPLPDWLYPQCEKLGITAVWDQRKTATGKSPLFKEAIPRGGTGHGKDGLAKGFWPN